MNLYLRSEKPEVIEKVNEFIYKLPEYNSRIAELKRDKNFAEYSADMPEGECELLLSRLLEDFPELDITAHIITDCEGRDRSFWNTTAYQSKTDENGVRRFEISRSTGWC